MNDMSNRFPTDPAQQRGRYLNAKQKFNLANALRAIISAEPNENGKFYYINDVINDIDAAAHLTNVMGIEITPKVVQHTRTEVLEFHKDIFLYRQRPRPTRALGTGWRGNVVSLQAQVLGLQSVIKDLEARIAKLEGAQDFV
jgi:hypothetical protein